jgi:Chlorophyllase enzyme
MQALSEYYKEYAELLASWGYAVLQYDLACLLPLPLCIYTQGNTTAEEQAMPAVLKWAHKELLKVDVQAQVVWKTVGVAGHSRGGGIAFHQMFNKDVTITSAVLLDPVLLENITATAPVGTAVLLAGAQAIQAFYLIDRSTGSCVAKPCKSEHMLGLAMLYAPAVRSPRLHDTVSMPTAVSRSAGEGSKSCAPEKLPTWLKKLLGLLGYSLDVSGPRGIAKHIPDRRGNKLLKIRNAGHVSFLKAPMKYYINWQRLFDAICLNFKPQQGPFVDWAAALVTGHFLLTMPPQLMSPVSFWPWQSVLVLATCNWCPGDCQPSLHHVIDQPGPLVA